MTLDLTPTQPDREFAADVLARNPGVEADSVLAAIGRELDHARTRAADEDVAGVVDHVRRAAALGDSYRNWRPDPRLTFRAAIMHSGRAR